MKRILITFLVSCLLAIASATQEIHQQHDEGTGIHIPGAGFSVLFIFGGLLFSGVAKTVLDKLNIPLNPILLIIGIILGNYYQHLGLLGKATKIISELNPNGILAIFLPTLVFQSAFKSQWYILKKQFGQIFILGVPCVILASILITVGIKWVIGYGDDSYNWRQAFLLACILCCTDIFSFVHKLKQYGAPQMLISLIEGQSLINYCTCVLIFQITNEIVIEYESHSFLEIFPLLIMETFGGFLFGLLFGFIALFLIKRVSYNGVLSVTVMVIFCYTIYMIMEFTVIKVSGIIALVTYGIFMGAFGKAHLVGEASKAMESFWSYAVFIAETNIFLIAGVLVGVNVLEFEHIFEFHFISFFEVYVIVLVARYLSILIFQPRLSNLGYGMQWKQSLVIAYCGLKGAIGISFAMIVFHQQDQYSETTRHLFLMHVTANSLFTLLINGMTSGLVINLLKLSSLTKIEYKFFKEYIESFKENVSEKKNDMMGQKSLNEVIWDEMDEKIGFDQLTKLQAEIDTTIQQNNFRGTNKFEKQEMYYLDQALQQYLSRNNPTNQAEQQYQIQNTKFQIIIEVRKRFLKNLKYKYILYHESHNTMPDASMLLIQSVNVDLDSQTESMQSWTWIKNQLSNNIRFASELRKSYFVGSFARQYLFSYISYCYDVVSSFIQANEETRKEFSQSRFGGALNQEAIKILLKQSQQNQKQAEDYLYNQLKPSFPEIEQEVVTRKASFNLLLSFRHIIDKYNESGQLEASQFELLSNLINKKKMALELHSPNWSSVSLKQCLMVDPVFSLLPEKVLTVLDEKLTDFESYNSKQIIQATSTISKHLYFIRSGACTIELTNGNIIYKETLRTGNIYGCESLISTTHRSTITTNTLCTIGSIRKNYIERVMDYFPDFEEAFWKQNLFYLLKMFINGQDVSNFMQHQEKEKLQEILSSFKLKRRDEGEITISEDCILLRGDCYIQRQGADLPEKIEPLTFFHSHENEHVEIKRRASFLVGKFPTPSLDETKFSISVSSATGKKKNVMQKRSFENQTRKDDLKIE